MWEFCEGSFLGTENPCFSLFPILLPGMQMQWLKLSQTFWDYEDEGPTLGLWREPEALGFLVA